MHRASPIKDIYSLASDWKKAQGLPEDRGTYPVSKYQQLRYALEDGNMEKAQEEYRKLKAAGETPKKIMLGFVESVNHPFTGSQKSDAAFRRSLPPEKQELYKLAVDVRRKILYRFGALVSQRGLPETLPAR